MCEYFLYRTVRNSETTHRGCLEGTRSKTHQTPYSTPSHTAYRVTRGHRKPPSPPKSPQPPQILTAAVGERESRQLPPAIQCHPRATGSSIQPGGHPAASHRVQGSARAARRGRRGTWHAGAQGHDRDGSDTVLELDRAAEVGGHVAGYGRQQTDAQDRDNETRVTVEHVCWTVDTGHERTG